MENLNKNQNGIPEEQTLKGKRSKIWKTVGSIVVSVLFLGFFYLQSHHPFFIGTPHIIEITGITIEPGKTTVREMADAGYELSDYNSRVLDMATGTMIYEMVYDIWDDADGNTYYYMIDVIKEDGKYAGMSAVNESKSSKPLADCLVRDLSVYSNSKGLDQVSVDGIPFSQLTKEKLVEVCGNPARDFTSTSDERTQYVWEKGNYSLEASFEKDGTIFSVTTKYKREN